MKEYLLILVGTALVNNFVLVQFLGLCPFLGVSQRHATALGMGLATTFVLTLAAALGYLAEHGLLQPLGVTSLRIPVFIVLVAAVVQFAELVIRRFSPLLHQVLGIFLPLITTNCAVLGVMLLNLRAHHDFIGAMLHGLGAALGFTLVLVLFAGVRERLDAADVPRPFRGQSIALITAGIAALAFMGFAGWVRD